MTIAVSNCVRVVDLFKGYLHLHNLWGNCIPSDYFGLAEEHACFFHKFPTSSVAATIQP